jgi:hypothetical protein
MVMSPQPLLQVREVVDFAAGSSVSWWLFRGWLDAVCCGKRGKVLGQDAIPRPTETRRGEVERTEFAGSYPGEYPATADAQKVGDRLRSQPMHGRST